MLSHGVMVVPAFCWRLWSVFKVLPWQRDKQMLRDVWPDSRWRAVGILKSHFLVFKRHPSRLGSGFLSSLTAAVQSVASQVLSGCILRCFKGPLGCHFERLQDKWRLRAVISDSCRPGRNTSRKLTADYRGVIDRDFTRLNLSFRCWSGKTVCPCGQRFVDVCSAWMDEDI